ncbi:MAG: nitroreductase family protein [bacterium]
MNANAAPARVPDHPVNPLFVDRWSPRSFSAASMTEAELLTLLEAARWAPSASNVQPWRFAYGLRGDDGFARIAAGLLPNNRSWAEKAAALVVVASKTTVEKDGAETLHKTHAFDAGAAWAHLALQAHLKGWIAHAMGGFDHAALRASLNVPENYALHAVVALGRQGDKAELPEGLQAREAPSGRNPLAASARHGSF